MLSLTGSLPALVTPFVDGQLDLDAVHRLVRWHVEQGSSGVVLGGSTGESAALEVDELGALVHVAREAARGRIPVIAATSANVTAHAISLARTAQAEGADALLHATGFYNRPSPRQVVAHFRAIAEACPLPLLVYDVPARTGQPLSLETLAEIATIPNVSGIKDATGEVARVAHQRRRIARPFAYLSGDDASAPGYVAMGGHGCISVTANIAPAACARVMALAAAGDVAAARERHERLLPLHAALFLEPSPAGIKYAMARAGLCREELRAPLMPVEPATRAAIDEALALAGVT